MVNEDDLSYLERRLVLAEAVCHHVSDYVDGSTRDSSWDVGEPFWEWVTYVEPNRPPDSGTYVRASPLPQEITESALLTRLKAAEDVCKWWDLSRWQDFADVYTDYFALVSSLDRWRALVDPFPSAGFISAVKWAAELHSGQLRKGTQVPYLSHLLEVASLVLREGGSEHEAIAGLLHDAIEDANASIETIRSKFGVRVAEIVEFCTEKQHPADRTPDNSFSRKVAHLEHLRSHFYHPPPGAVLVTLADKISNARSIVRDLRELGEDLWSRFNVAKEVQVWYYDQLGQIGKRWPLLRERYVELFEELETLASEMKSRGNVTDDDLERITGAAARLGYLPVV